MQQKKENLKLLINSALKGGAIVLLIIALLNNPYGYYILLRWVLFVVFLFMVYESGKKGNYLWVFLFVLLAVIYNPIKSLHLGRIIWTWVNIATMIILLASIEYKSILNTLKKNERKKDI